MEKFLITQKRVAGTTAADTIHHHDENDNVTIVTDESFPLLFHRINAYYNMKEYYSLSEQTKIKGGLYAF